MSTFQFYAAQFARNGYLPADDLKTLDRVALAETLDPATEDMLRFYGAGERLASRLIAEQSSAWLSAVALAQEIADLLPVSPERVDALVSTLRNMRGDPPASLAKKFGCGRNFGDVADAIQRVTNPRPHRARVN